MKKIIKRYGAILIMVITIAACRSTNQVADTTSAANAGISADSSKWVFTPTNIMPQYGNPRQADFGFSVTYNSNKLMVYLPYFGRAFSGADVLSTKGPLDFNSADFTIVKRETKKNRWSVTIKPNDYREVQSLNFMFYSNGSANLTVTMTNRTPISFSGTIAGWKP